MVTVALVFLAVAIALVHFATIVWKAMTYWKVRGVKHMAPLPIVGNMFRALGFNKHFFHLYDKVYHAFPEERMVGMYEFMTPTLVVRDTELIERVLIREFSTYPNRGPFGFEPSSVLFLSVFNITGNRWRALRNKLLTTFTTGRLRSAFPTISDSCLEFLNSNPKELNRDLISKFAIRTFMRTMFGMELLEQGEEELNRKIRKMFDPTLARMAQQVALIFFPRLANFLHFSFMPKYLDTYFRSFINKVLSKRMVGCSSRDDFADVLIQMKKAKKLKICNRDNKILETFDVTDEIAQAQALFFLFAGLEPTVLLLLHATYDLARSTNSQAKAREEIRSVLQKYGEICWESLKDMKYLHCCIKETLRLHPSLQFINRVCKKEAELGGVKIKKGTRIVIPIHTIQKDPKYFHDPEEYLPERFLEEIGHAFSYLPFSDGPRVCLGKRFATMELAIFMAHLLENYELSPSREMKLPLKYEPKALFLTPKSNNQIIIDLKKISEN